MNIKIDNKVVNSTEELRQILVKILVSEDGKKQTKEELLREVSYYQENGHN